MYRSLALVLPATLALAGMVACYTADFDETLSDVYYCQTSTECGETQTCFQFRCVDDSGPHVRVTGPESLQNVQFGTATLTVNYTAEDFTVSDSNAKTEGEGKLVVSIAGTEISTTSIISQGAQLDISSLAPGAHRLLVQAVYGDGTPYTNPSATGSAVFYLEAENPSRPQAALVSPLPGYVHVLGEALDVTVAARNFAFVESGEDCRVEDPCDPWGPDAAMCLPACAVVPQGHAHVYMLSDYPACLNNAITCNGDYVLSLRPSESVGVSGTTATARIPADRFTEAGPVTFSIGLQYNDHLPYPNQSVIIYDQITIEVVER
ncbi:hypothetical protein [Enhygromyxa salina]|uniref:Bacterial Ig-like domain-containing protein n=1 Tax=Enhygromyxa salina TaxID=215803 RepID=A0A2S9XTT6_9BACT|nr:hypothetical protein [Enhygromyxa salina]PRP96288.1 hypothetical protein ENSA7_71030 [Enhygromyxa salina]